MSDAKGTPKKGVQSQDAKKQPEENGDEELNKVSDDIELSLNADEEDLEEVEAENEAGGEYDSPLKAAMKALAMSTCVKILGFKRSNNMETDLATWHKFFKEMVEVDVPQIQPPGLEDLWIIFKMKTIQDKHKLFQWIKKNKYDGVKMRVKTITIKESKDILEVEELPLDDALDILYPRRNVLYADQLKDKHASMKTIIDEKLLPIKEIEKFTTSKKYLKNIRAREMLPFSPMDGYEHNVLIFLEKKEDGEVSYGLRAVRHGAGNEGHKLSTTIVPLEQCLSVPRQMTLVAKNILTGLTKAGLEPYCPATKEGELLGFSLRINHQGHFMLIVIIKKPGAIAFHEFTPEKIVLNDGEPLGEPYRALVQNKVKEISEKVTQFYESEGKDLGIRSVYSTLLPEQVILYQMSSGVWNNLPRPEHVVGDQQLLDKINGVTLKITWDREKYTEIYNSVLPLFDGVTFNNTTKVYLVSPNKHIGYYFAKKCGHVTQIGLRQPDFGSKLKPENVKNLEFLNFTAKLRKPVSTENTVVVWWPFTLTASTRKNKKFNLVQQFLNFGLTNMAFITFWGKNNDNLDKYQNHMETVYSKLKINRIIPFDTEPYKDGYGLFVLFKGFLDDLANKPGIPNKFAPKFSPKFSRGGGAVGAGGRGGFKRPLGSAGGPRDIRVMRRVDPFERQSGPGGFGGRGGSSGGGFGGRGGFSGPKRPSALQRLGPRLNDYQGPAESPWSQDSSSTQKAWNQIEQVAGVVQNLQNMAQQMQAFIEHKQQPAQQQSSSWSLKRRYPEEDDQYYQGERSGGSGGGRWAGMGSGGGRSGGDSWADSGRQASGASGDYNRWQGATGNGTTTSQARPADSYYDMIDYNHDNKRRREDTSYTDSRSGGGSGWGAGGGSSQASNSYSSSYGERPSAWGKPTVSAAPTYYNHSAAPNHPSTRNYY